MGLRPRRDRCARAPFRFFVKQVQSWARSPFFQFVPEEYRELAVGGGAVEDRGRRLPLRPGRPAARRADGTPRARRLRPRRESSSIWLEEVPPRQASLGPARGTSARRTSSAGSPAAPPWRRSASLRHVDWSLDTYATGRLEVQVVPMLMSDEIWQHPSCAAFDDELRDRLRAAAGRRVALAAEGDALPTLLSHGDACPNNLLAGAGRRLRDDRLRLLGRRAGRLRPDPAPGRRRPDRQAQRRGTSPSSTRPS